MRIMDFPPSAQATIDEKFVEACFLLLLGRATIDDTELKAALHIARRAQDARLELVRYILDRPDYLKKARPFLALMVDKYARSHAVGRREVRRANLFCIGAARSGTTTLAEALQAHSEVYVSPIKETNFFSHFSAGASRHGVPGEIYEMYFFAADKQKYIGDFSPNVLRYRHAVAGIHNYNPDAKIIASLRNPVERAISAYFYKKEYHKYDDIDQYFDDGLRTFHDFDPQASPETEVWHSPYVTLRSGLYSRDLSFALSLFPDMHIVNFHELAQSSERVYRGLGEFLELEFSDELLRKISRIKSNSAGGYHSRVTETLISKLDEFYRKDRAELGEKYGIYFD